MDSATPIFPFPIYIGQGLSQGVLVPPNQLSALVSPRHFRPPVSAPRLSPSSISGADPYTSHGGISIQLHVHLVRICFNAEN